MTQNNDNKAIAIFLKEVLMPALTRNEMLIFWFLNKYYAEHEKKPLQRIVAKGLGVKQSYISVTQRQLTNKINSLCSPEMSKLLLDWSVSVLSFRLERSTEWTKNETREIIELTDNPILKDAR